MLDVVAMLREQEEMAALPLGILKDKFSCAPRIQGYVPARFLLAERCNDVLASSKNPCQGRYHVSESEQVLVLRPPGGSTSLSDVAPYPDGRYNVLWKTEDIKETIALASKTRSRLRKLANRKMPKHI